MDVIVLYQDMRTYGLLEDYYARPGTKGSCFAAMSPAAKPPQVGIEGDELNAPIWILASSPSF